MREAQNITRLPTDKMQAQVSDDDDIFITQSKISFDLNASVDSDQAFDAAQMLGNIGDKTLRIGYRTTSGETVCIDYSKLLYI